MAQTTINGGTQIRSGTITTTQLSSAAGITDGQLATSYIKADGTRAFTGEVGGVTPTALASLATKGYVDGVAQGLDAKPSARAMTTTETLTIASGSVTSIAGLTVDGVTINIGDYILIPNAPASTGAAGGTTFSTQPANGLYKVSANTTNLTVARAPEQSAGNPAGDYVFVEAGTVAGGGFVVITPSSGAAFIYGTGNILWTQFSGAGEITVDATLTKTGNQLSRPAITGDVTISTGSNAATIAAAAVTLAKLANLAANSVIGNSTGSSATPTAVPLAVLGTASAIALRDANANLTTNSFIGAVATTATAAGTTTLTVASAQTQQFTGATTQTVVMPNATTLVNGQSYFITNRSSGVVTVNMNGGSLLQTMAAGSQLEATLINNGTAAGTWDAAYSVAGAAGGTVTSVSVVTANGFSGTVATSTTTPAITIQTSLAAGVLKSNGSNAIALATTSDIVAGLANRETPSGTVNGSTTAFTLAFTPVSGTEMVFKSGVLQDPGGANDYTISGAVVTFNTAPATGDTIRVTYWH